MRNFGLFALVACLLAGPVAAQSRADPEGSSERAPTTLIQAKSHMIVAANPLAAEAGATVLVNGGSAADAAIAALLVLNVVEPQSSGIGGGAFALIHTPDGPISLDARETAPAGASPGMFLRNGAPMPWREAVATGGSIGVPGLVRLMEEMHRRHGKLEWASLFRPAIALARDGFPVSPRLAELVSRYGARLDGSEAGDLLRPRGEPLSEGALLRQPELADTLERIASGGADAFYSGPVAQAIVDAVAAGPTPGTLSLEDLSGYRVIERAPVCHPFFHTRVCGMGPPSSGATTVGQILMLLDGQISHELSPHDALVWHLFAEASRLAYADRAAYLADSDFVPVPVRGLLEPSYIAERGRLIDREKAAPGKADAGQPPWREGRLYAPDTSPGSPGTTHLSVVDSDGLAISLTASIETAFGSGRMAAGFLLNNQLTDFSFAPVGDGRPIANAVAPRKRPRSSMAPTIVYRGTEPMILTGSPGGSRIPEYVAQNLLAIVVFGMDPGKAAALPHVSQRNGASVRVDPEMPARIVETLKSLGHEVEVGAMNSGVHTIVIAPDGTLIGGVDPRREGAAVGR